MADLAMCFAATGSCVNRNDVLYHYDGIPDKISAEDVRVKLKKFAARMRQDAAAAAEPSAYLSRFADNYYINRVKHPTF